MFYASQSTTLSHVDGVEIYTFTGRWIVRDGKYGHSPYKPSMQNWGSSREQAVKMAERLNKDYNR